jgi:asparagine synthase (glutamine-hydrolysing)
LRLISDGSKDLMRIRTDRGLAGKHQGLSGAFLRNFLEFTAKAEYAYDYGMPQWLAKIDHRIKWLHPERAFLGRHKFYHFRIWYRDFLSNYLRAVLLDERSLSRPYLERRAVQTMLDDHISGRHNYTLGINKLLSLELIHRLFIDGMSQANEAASAVRTSSLQPQI